MSRGICCGRFVAATWGGSFAFTQVIRRHLFLAVLLVFIAWDHTPYALAKPRPESDAQLMGVRVRPKLGLGEKTMEATADDKGPENITYSVILVAKTHHCSNTFRDQERVNAFSTGVVSVTSTRPFPQTTIEDRPGHSPFSRGHLDGVDKRVRIVYLKDFGDTLTIYQISHLKAACEDPSERTVMCITDETCETRELLSGLPPACWSNIVRHYPYNAPSPDMETRNSYSPLGPRDTFPFVQEDARKVASKRSLFFNLEVTPRTSQRRDELITITREYEAANPDVPCHNQGTLLESGQWQALLLDSKFTLCPGGHNPETFRMFEALEAGSIPIVSKEDYMNPAFRAPYACGEGNASWNTVAASPYAKAVSVETWQELPVLLDRLRYESDDVIEKLQADCMAWYRALMTRSYASLLNFGDGLELWPQGGPILYDFSTPS